MYGELVLGWDLRRQDAEVRVSAPKAAYHTAVVAQSGAGKSSVVARLVEEILLSTRARVVLLDANGDFRRAGSPNCAAWPGTNYRGEPRLPSSDYRCPDAFLTDWSAKVPQLHLARPGAGDLPHASAPVTCWWSDLTWPEQLAVLGVDEWAETGEAEALHCMLDALSYVPGAPMTFHRLREAFEFDLSPTPARRRVYHALQRLEHSGVWGGPEERAALSEHIGKRPPSWRLLVVDLVSVHDPTARAVVGLAALNALWRVARESWEDAALDPARPDTRVPTFVVIDEAHNFVPSSPGPALTERLASRIMAIAAEGRKFGVFVLLATQRPAKVRPGLLHECENVCILRLQSPVDHQACMDTWGMGPSSLEAAPRFECGQGLLFGRWVPEETLFRAAFRRTAEGGASLDKDHWAAQPPDLTAGAGPDC